MILSFKQVLVRVMEYINILTQLNEELNGDTLTPGMRDSKIKHRRMIAGKLQDFMGKLDDRVNTQIIRVTYIKGSDSYQRFFTNMTKADIEDYFRAVSYWERVRIIIKYIEVLNTADTVKKL